jgi:hypothetical protein
MFVKHLLIMDWILFYTLLFTQLILRLKLKVTFGYVDGISCLDQKNEYYFLVVLLDQCTMVGSKIK